MLTYLLNVAQMLHTSSHLESSAFGRNQAPPSCTFSKVLPATKIINNLDYEQNNLLLPKQFHMTVLQALQRPPSGCVYSDNIIYSLLLAFELLF